jgi:hypothetical protein
MIKLIDILDEAIVGDFINKIKSIPGNIALKKRISQFNELEIKIFEYQNDYNGPINTVLEKYASFFKYYCNSFNNSVSKLENKELAKFLTKHYKQDLQPELTGMLKNTLLAHGGKNYKSLDVIDVDKFLGTNMPNKGHFGPGFYLTNAVAIKVAEHYGNDVQPMVINNVLKPLDIRPGTKNYYGNTDFEGKNVIAYVNAGKYLGKDNYQLYADITGVPELDKMWLQNSKKEGVKELIKQLKDILSNKVSDEQIKDMVKNVKFQVTDKKEPVSSLTSSPSLETVYKQGKYDLIITTKNTSGIGLDKYPKAEVVVLKDKAQDVKSIYPSIEGIMKSDGQKIERNMSSANIHD